MMTDLVLYIALGILAIPLFAIFLGILTYGACIVWYALISDLKGK